STTVVEVEGEERVKSVTVAEVDERRRPIPGTERKIPCDTLLLSVGLIPENELTRQAGISIDPVTNGAAVRENRETSIPGVFACGNVLHVHDLVDFVSEEGEIAGNAAADYLMNTKKIETAPVARITAKDGVRYTVPELIGDGETPKVTVFFRVADSFRDATLVAENESGVILSKKVRRMVPGEMQRVDLPREKLVGTVTLRVEPKA
ncbi:MAG: FAD-dependent oxidoreductase, partial [Clostridia bacterium]|nr:FAD-dependent oxidoreductase [Clostridia bacterium]